MHNIVIRSPNWIGDFVLSIPALRGLKNHFPCAELTMVAHKRVAGIAMMVDGVDRVIEYDSGRKDRGVKSAIGFSRRISSEPIGLFVVFPLSFSSALMGYLSGAGRRLGYSTEMRGFLLTDKVRLPRDFRERHLTETYGNLVAEIGVVDGLGEPRLRVQEACGSAEMILKQHGVDRETRLIGMAPHASYGPAKLWPAERFSELSTMILKEYDCRILLFGSEEDSGLPMDAGLAAEGIVDLRGKLTLPEAAYVLRQCGCLVSNDTGIAHVAAAVGTPVVSIFGSTSPEWTSPIGKDNVVVYERIDCSPCFDRECRFGHYKCLKGIGADVVFNAVQEALA
jgi:heptosyltransferase-2